MVRTLQSYEELDNPKNNIKQKNLNTVFDNISKTISPTSDSFLLIMSQMASEEMQIIFTNRHIVTQGLGTYIQ